MSTSFETYCYQQFVFFVYRLVSVQSAVTALMVESVKFSGEFTHKRI